MPSSATITAFYNFTANTKARASQVNANFDVFRGHIIPIEVLTSTAAPSYTYDLGSSEYAWRNLYIKSIYQNYSVTTSSSTITSFVVTNHFTTSLSTTTVTPIAGTTFTIQTIGKPLKIGLTTNGIGNLGTDSQILTPDQVTGIITKMSIVRDNTTITVFNLAQGRIPPSSVFFYDHPAAGSHTYYFCASQSNTTASGALTNCRVYAHEITI